MRLRSRSLRVHENQGMLSLIDWIPYTHEAIAVKEWTPEDIYLLREYMLSRYLCAVANMGPFAKQGIENREDAWAWILSEEESLAYPFSFRNCVKDMGGDPELLRVNFARIVLASKTAHEEDKEIAREIIKKARKEIFE